MTRALGVAALSPALRGISANGLVDVVKESGAIHLNQVGFLSQRMKMATIVSSSAGSANHFAVRSLANNAVIFKGDLSVSQTDEASGDAVRIADFSTMKEPGSYRVELESGKQSPPFAVGPHVYHDALHLSMRAFYGQRCGCAVDLGGGYRHPTCHLKDAFHATSGKTGPFANHGGWHDAGDYGRYVVNSGISTGTLLWAWEFYGDRLRSLALAIPESGGKTPDFLAEVRWNLDWMLSMQDADGGVWHKQTSGQFCGFIMPEADTLVSYVIGTGAAPYKSTCATADLAAVAAIAARCYGPYDDAYAQRCLSAARKAYTWALANPAVYFHNPSGIGTGEYGDDHATDELQWAEAELWRTTGEAQYDQAFRSGIVSRLSNLMISALTWSNVDALGCWSYALADRKGDAQTIAAIRSATQASAEGLVKAGRAGGYGNTLSISDYIWGSNSVAANHSMLLLAANRLQPNPEFVNAALDNLHYLLGRNCFGVSWVTQVGTNPFQHPHHRPSFADGIAAPWPGLLSGGPNGKPSDPVGDKLPKQPPMRMWADETQAYSLNEVAINWNAPLVFLLAGVNGM